MDYKAVVIGASAGGLNALQEILAPLPADFPLPILVVQHRPPTADELLAFALNESCQLTVKEADEKDYIESGWVYVAPSNYHLLVERDRTLSLSADAKVCFSRPSIDVLFESIAQIKWRRMAGVLLTGANHDGAAGLAKIKARGGYTIVQDPATAEVPVMPQAAIDLGTADHVLALAGISSFLVRHFANQDGVDDS